MLFLLVEHVQLHKALGNLMSTAVSQHAYNSVNLMLTALSTYLHQCQLDVDSPLNIIKSVSN